MEIPKIYRETPARVSFTGEMKLNEKTGNVYFKYPGGEIPVMDVYDFVSRLENRGFGDKEILEIVELFLNTVATEATVSSSKVFESVD